MLKHYNGATGAASVTPSDTVNFGNVSCWLIVGVTGNVSVEMLETGKAIVIPMVAGVMYAIRATRVNATSTTATGIVALW